MIEELIARVTADKMKLAKFEKNTTKPSKQMNEKEEKKKLNSDENLPLI